MTDWSDINSLRAALMDARNKLSFINGMSEQAAKDALVSSTEVVRKHFEMIAEKSKLETP